MRIKRKPPRDTTIWHDYFIWFPDVVEGHWVWLETVERRFVPDPSPCWAGGNDHWEYQLKRTLTHVWWFR